MEEPRTCDTSSQIELLAPSPLAWIECVLQQFDRFLLDHASAERKASARAVSFVDQYPDKYGLHEPMIRLAREELLHYQQVMRLIHSRGLLWKRDEKDPYIRGLQSEMSTNSRLRLLDRLLVGGVVEARGVERFALVAKHLKDIELAGFYDRLSKSEAHHADLFLELAHQYFPSTEVKPRLDFWLALEAHTLNRLEIRPVLH